MKKLVSAISLVALAAMTLSMAFAATADERVSFEDPINKKCPLTGKEIVAGRTVEYEKQLIGFCCQDCVGKFESDPKKYIGKVKEFKKKKSQPE